MICENCTAEATKHEIYKANTISAEQKRIKWQRAATAEATTQKTTTTRTKCIMTH